MITLYHAPNTRSSRVLWLLEEMGVPYEAIPCGVRNQPAEMQAHNPSRTVPVMTDGDLVLTESVTMLEYIAATYGPTPLAMTPDEPGYWDYRQLLLYGEATLSAPLNAIVGTTFFGPDDQKDNWTLGLVRLSFRKRLGVAARRLETSDYVAGGRFTIADISVVYSIHLALRAEMFGLKDLITPQLAAYRDRLAARPAFKKAFS